MINQKNTFGKFLPELLTASGNFEFPMTNDYMFRAVLQSNIYALKGFISALLRIRISTIRSVVITNPIILGESCKDKEFRLDINVVFNDNTIINLEMQISFQSDWRERSLVYLCRNVNHLSHGQEYSQLKRVIHIGILDFTLFPDKPEFYAQYTLMNKRTQNVYSDKIALYVLDLNHIELATEEDKAWGLDYWAKLFKTNTWEELRMIAQNNEYLTEACNCIYLMNADYNVCKRCHDRADYYHEINKIEGYKKQIAESENIIAHHNSIIAQNKATIAQNEATIAQDKATIAQNKATIDKQAQELAALQDENARLKALLAEKE